MSLGGLRVLGNDWWLPYCRDEFELSTSECARMARYNVITQDDYVAETITIYRRAFQYAYSRGNTVVAAAGNSALDADRAEDTWLAFVDFPHTIGVSATGPIGWCLDPSTSVDRRAYYSNYGSSVIDLAAPGGDFFGFFLGAPYTDDCTKGLATAPAWAFDGIYSTIAGGWGWAQGTSMAAPHVTGGPPCSRPPTAAA